MLKAVIFDVGGVLVRTSSRAGREKWAARLGLDSWDLERLIFNSESGRQAQLGQKTDSLHWRWLQGHLGLSEADIAELRRDFFAGDALNEPLLAQIRRLRQAGYRIGLLSNAADNTRRLLNEVYPLLDMVDGVVISAEVGIMKPDPRIYALAAESVGVRPEEALLVDDFIENVEGARRAGMPALHFTNPAAAQQELEALTGVE